MLVESPDRNRALLVRAHNSRFPPGMVTCPTGFVEQAESAEQACMREVLEETGVRIDPDTIKVVLTQAWPQGTLLQSDQQRLIWSLGPMRLSLVSVSDCRPTVVGPSCRRAECPHNIRLGQ